MYPSPRGKKRGFPYHATIRIPESGKGYSFPSRLASGVQEVVYLLVDSMVEISLGEGIPLKVVRCEPQDFGLLDALLCDVVLSVAKPWLCMGTLSHSIIFLYWK